MAADTRKWAKIDLGYLTNPKMSDVLDASSNAPLMHLASILHCAQHLTDGHVSPKAMQRIIGGDSDDTVHLVNAGLWHEPGHDCEECPQPKTGQVYVHNYLDHNVSSDKVDRLSEQAKNAARARWDSDRSDAPGNASGMQNASKTDASRNADRMPTALQNAMPEREERKKKKEREEEPPKTGPHPLPDGFSISSDMRQWAEKITPAVNVERQTAEFIDYWTNGGGKGKRKSDWRRAWQNNLKQKQEWAERDGWKPKPPPDKDLTDPKNW